jgi:hypothetical protein
VNRKLIATVSRRTAQIVLALIALLLLSTIVFWILFGGQSLEIN